ncbi:inositol-pentakisphosphate 2-kinase [Takifugu rubripes]|uniref:inositol-pentakisphosphate 2-kinase n=1 Tax=Takifugu rubripes TaxID=31033 RepID=UPI0011457F53|nr:inositol-pentakisphosphate 2-kinase [Takifugu rubripes]
MQLDKMDENDWVYHGEGNKNLVVAHVKLSRVLRLLKYPAEDSENPPQSAEQAFRQIQNIVDFSSNVMSILLGEKFVHSGEVVKLPLEFVRQLSIKVQHERPGWRCDKVIDIYSGCALSLPNLTYPVLHLSTHTPPLCVEIKPKWGFLPSSKHVSKDIKSKVCRFCMYQLYKVATGKWKKRSLYCPLDLFSGNKQRMHFAIRQLIEEPQNNLKIFKGGQCIYSRKDSDDSLDLNSLLHHLRPYFLQGNNRFNCHMTNKAVLNDFIQVLMNALLSSEGREGGPVNDRHAERQSYCDASLFNKERSRQGSQGLPGDSVLSRILQTQMLDMRDIEELYPLYHRVEQHLQDFPKQRARLHIEGPYNKEFLEMLQKCPAEDDGSVEYAATKIHQYLITKTAKDCSIMVALVPSSDKEEDDEGYSWRRGSRPPPFTSLVSILDLDPKPFDSILYQLRLDQTIVSFYLQTRSALPEDSVSSHPTICAAPEKEECTLLFHPV